MVMFNNSILVASALTASGYTFMYRNVLDEQYYIQDKAIGTCSNGCYLRYDHEYVYISNVGEIVIMASDTDEMIIKYETYGTAICPQTGCLTTAYSMCPYVNRKCMFQRNNIDQYIKTSYGVSLDQPNQICVNRDRVCVPDTLIKGYLKNDWSSAKTSFNDRFLALYLYNGTFWVNGHLYNSPVKDVSMFEILNNGSIVIFTAFDTSFNITIFDCVQKPHLAFKRLTLSHSGIVVWKFILIFSFISLCLFGCVI